MNTQQLERINALKVTQTRIRELTEVADHLKAAIIADLGDADEVTDGHGNRLLTYRQSRIFNVELAAEFLPAEAIASCVKPDPARIKKLLTGDQLDTCMAPGPRRFVLVD